MDKSSAVPNSDLMSNESFNLAVRAAMAVHANSTSATGSDSAFVGALDSVTSVSVKLPGFWSDNPKGWFHQAEEAFAIRNPLITVERTKYGHVATSLCSKTSLKLAAVLDNPPRGQEYQALKEALLLTFDQSQTAKDT